MVGQRGGEVEIGLCLQCKQAIYSGCVPVIISDHYVLPFSDVLNWDTFSVFVPPPQIPNLKNILQSIPTETYVKLHGQVIEA